MSIQVDQLIEKTTRELFKICYNGDSSTRLFYKQNKDLLTISKFHLFTNRACSKNIVSIIKYIFEQQKFDFVFINYFKMLEIARRNDSVEIIELLKMKAQKMNSSVIIREDNINYFMFLKEMGLEITRDTMLKSIIMNAINIIRYLISIEVDIVKEYFVCSIHNHQHEIFQLLMGSVQEDPELYFDSVDEAIESGNFYILKYCLDYINSKTSLNNDNYISSVAITCIEERQIDMLEYLLEKYSNLNIEIEHSLFCDLITEDDIEILNTLSDYKIKATYDQIQYSITLDNLEIFVILLSAYEPYIPEDLKYSSVAYACKVGRIDILRYIIDECGSPYGFFDNFVQIAYEWGHYDIAYYFIEEHMDKMRFPIEQNILNNVRSRILGCKFPVAFIGEIKEEKECGICTLQLQSCENIVQCTVCKNLTHTECYSKWGKACIYCRN